MNEKTVDQNYWEAQYLIDKTAWDLGAISPPFKSFIDKLEDKNLSILIPGCGNAYEAEYLLQKGFANITLIDIAPTLVEKLQLKFHHQKALKIICGDFFEHQSSYDLILEQTFFCALPPILRLEYVAKMYELLSDNGMLVGLLFNRTFEGGPPFGGSKIEYETLFSPMFEFLSFDISLNSIAPRAQKELWIEFRKK